MNNFTFNSACALIEKNAVSMKFLEIVNAVSEYLENKPRPNFYSEDEINDFYISKDFLFLDFIDSLKKSDRDLADFLTELSDKIIYIPDEFRQNIYNVDVKVGDDTRFSKNVSLYYACENKNILISISDENFWNRTLIKFYIHSTKNESLSQIELYNIFSGDVSYLPIEKPPFSLHDVSRFTKTNFHHNNENIYLEKGTGYYWYNDFFHRNSNPHFEVFDKNGRHIGEANMSGVLDRLKTDRTKTIKVN